jgi:ATP-dependent exoDNAse (exonuclease V) alpha subunit
VTWSANEFEGFRHGYAGTIYKAQGKTLDRTYL